LPLARPQVALGLRLVAEDLLPGLHGLLPLDVLRLAHGAPLDLVALQSRGLEARAPEPVVQEPAEPAADERRREREDEPRHPVHRTIPAAASPTNGFVRRSRPIVVSSSWPG